MVLVAFLHEQLSNSWSLAIIIIDLFIFIIILINEGIIIIIDYILQWTIGNLALNHESRLILKEGGTLWLIWYYIVYNLINKRLFLLHRFLLLFFFLFFFVWLGFPIVIIFFFNNVFHLSQVYGVEVRDRQADDFLKNTVNFLATLIWF